MGMIEYEMTFRFEIDEDDLKSVFPTGSSAAGWDPYTPPEPAGTSPADHPRRGRGAAPGKVSAKA